MSQGVQPGVDGFGVPLPEHAVARFGHDGVMTQGDIWSLAVSDDGKLAAALAEQTCIFSIWDLVQKKRVRDIPTEHSGACFFTSDAQGIIGVSPLGEMACWDTTTGNLVWKQSTGFDIHGTWRSESGDLAYVLSSEGYYKGLKVAYTVTWSLQTLDMQTGQLSAPWLLATTMHDWKLNGTTHLPYVVADITPDGKTLVIGIIQGRLGPLKFQFYDVLSRTLLRATVFSIPDQFDVKVSPDGEGAVATFRGDEPYHLDRRTGELRKLPDVPGEVLRWYDDRRLAVHKPDEGIFLWDINSGELRQLSKDANHPFAERLSAFSRDRKSLVTYQRMIQVWDVPSGGNRTAEWPSMFPEKIHFGKSQIHVDQRFRFDRGTYGPVDLPAARNSTGKLLSDVDDEIHLYQDDDDHLVLVDSTTGKTLWRSDVPLLKRPIARTRAQVLFSSDRKWVCFSWHNYSGFRVFDLASGKQCGTGEHLPICVSSNHVLCWSYDMLHLYEVGKGAVTREEKVQQVNYEQVGFSPDSRRLVLPDKSMDGKALIQVWNVERWQIEQTIRLQSERYDAIAWSPDGKTLAVVPKERDHVQFWNVATARQTGVLRHVAGAVAFAPEGGLLATTGLNSVLIWNYPECVQVSRSD